MFEVQDLNGAVYADGSVLFDCIQEACALREQEIEDVGSHTVDFKVIHFKDDGTESSFILDVIVHVVNDDYDHGRFDYYSSRG